MTTSQSAGELLKECRKKLLNDIKPECWAGTARLIDTIDAHLSQASEPIVLDAVMRSKLYPECSGDPASCPENEGYGCCQRGTA